MTMSTSESIFKMTEQIYNLQAENAKLNAIIDGYQPKIQALKDENFELKESLKCFQKPEVVKVLTDYRTGEIDNLKAENERLKEEVETRDNLIDHFRDEALYRATIASEYQKDKTKLEQTLQEIKEIAEALSCKHPEDCWENIPDWNGEVYGCDVANNWKEPSELATCPSKLASAILQIITKAEEE